MENNPLKNVELYLLDLDGTLYLGNNVFPCSYDFLKSLKEHHKRYVFLTNNTSRGKEEYFARLKKMGFELSLDDIFTAGDATILYLKENNFPKDLALFGTPSLEQQFIENGFNPHSENPQYIVLGYDKTITFEKLTYLCELVKKGLPYIATHPDFNCPVENGFIPDIGAMMAFVEASTKRKADIIIGKPNHYIVDAVSNKYGVKKENIAMVGDRLYTDIALGKYSPIKTILVLSGETSLDKYQSQDDVKADLVLENVGKIPSYLD